LPGAVRHGSNPGQAAPKLTLEANFYRCDAPWSVTEQNLYQLRSDHKPL